MGPIPFVFFVTAVCPDKVTAPPTLLLVPADHDALQREVDENLSHGRSFVPDAGGVELFAQCKLRIEHPGGEALVLPVEVVMVSDSGPMVGVAVQLRDFSDATRERIRRWAKSGSLRELSPAQQRQQKVRGLNASDRLKLARDGTLEERVMLERAYGKAVWEALLRNPRVTLPEVARIARKGTLPRPLLEQITDNENWVRQSVVRRALLTNPRLSSDGAMKVLRGMPHRELRLLANQNGYSSTVRALAKKLAGT